MEVVGLVTTALGLLSTRVALLLIFLADFLYIESDYVLLEGIIFTFLDFTCLSAFASIMFYGYYSFATRIYCSWYYDIRSLKAA